MDTDGPPSWVRAPRRYAISGIPLFYDTLKALLADAENTIRTRLGVPRIGEGWVAEAEMVNLLRERFHPHPVIPQGSPAWLGAQRFDAYIPDIGLAVEYQGL